MCKKIIAAFLGVMLFFAPLLTNADEKIYNGADISEYQGDIDFTAVKEDNIDIVYIRVGEGFDYTDPYFETNYSKAKAAGLYVGFYYYVTAETQVQAQAQAMRFARLTENKKIDCRAAMDYEPSGNVSRNTANAVASTFLKTFRGILP